MASAAQRHQPAWGWHASRHEQAVDRQAHFPYLLADSTRTRQRDDRLLEPISGERLQGLIEYRLGTSHLEAGNDVDDPYGALERLRCLQADITYVIQSN